MRRFFSPKYRSRIMHAVEIHNAVELAEFNLRLALGSRPYPTMRFTGACYYCKEAVHTGCFCSTECRTDYERIERAKQHRKVA